MLYPLVLLLHVFIEAYSFESSAGAAVTGSLSVGPGWNEPAFNRQIVRPIVVDQQGRHKRQLDSTRHDNGHIEQLKIILSTANGTRLSLDVILNKDLLPPAGSFVRYHHGNESEGLKPDREAEQLPLCNYRGTVRSVVGSWVSLSTCDGLSGLIFDGNDFYSIEPNSSSSLLTDDHWLMKYDQRLTNQSANHSSMKKRQINQQQNQMTNTTYYVELVVVVDNTLYRRHGSSGSRVTKRVRDIVNIVNGLYNLIGVSVVLTGVIFWSDRDKISITSDSSRTLSDFTRYRERTLRAEIDKHDTAHLFTAIKQIGAVGKAWVDVMCSSSSQACGIIVDDDSASLAITASIITHEMGHNFGLHHDEDDSKCNVKIHCPLGNCVMTRLMSGPLVRWSSCSQQNFTRIRETKGKLSCLLNRPNTCGNLELDEGEECDCGKPGLCSNPCCNPLTCKFSRADVKCATGLCCDLSNCNWKLAGVPCRPVDDKECDLPEHCLGDRKECPADLYRFNGAECLTRKNKVCLDGICSLKLRNKYPVCTVNCSSNGQCNHLGKCHCDPLFDPHQNCSQFGTGGSVDGGPTLDPSVIIYSNLELYVIFLAVLPIIVFLLICWYCQLNDEQKMYIRNATNKNVQSLKNVQNRNLAISSQILAVSCSKEDEAATDGKKGLRNLQLKIPPVINIDTSLASTPDSGNSTATILFTPETPSTTIESPLRPVRPAPPPPPPAVSAKVATVESLMKMYSQPRQPPPCPPPPPPPPAASKKPRFQ